MKYDFFFAQLVLAGGAMSVSLKVILGPCTGCCRAGLCLPRVTYNPVLSCVDRDQKLLPSHTCTLFPRGQQNVTPLENHSQLSLLAVYVLVVPSPGIKSILHLQFKFLFSNLAPGMTESEGKFFTSGDNSIFTHQVTDLTHASNKAIKINGISKFPQNPNIQLFIASLYHLILKLEGYIFKFLKFELNDCPG